MSEHHNGMKKQGKDQAPLHHQQKFNDDKEQPMLPDQDPGKGQQGGPPKAQAPESPPAERD